MTLDVIKPVIMSIVKVLETFKFVFECCVQVKRETGVKPVLPPQR